MERKYFEMSKEALVDHGRIMDKIKNKDKKVQSLGLSKSPSKNSKVKYWK